MSDAAEFELRLIDKVSGTAQKITGDLSVLQKALGSVGEHAKESGDFLESAFAHALGEKIEAVADKIIELGKEAVATTVEFADFAQRSELAFTQLAKFGASPQKLFEQARSLAVGLGLDVEDTTHAFEKFLKLQFNPAQATQMIEMGADLQALGATSEEVQRVFLQLGQVQSKGRLQGEELTALSENGISTKLVFDALSHSLGKTTDDVQKLVQAGKIDAGTGLAAIGEAIKHKTGETEFGQAGAKFAASTLSGMAGVLKAKTQDLMTEVGSKAAPALASALGTGAAAFDQIFSGANQAAFVDTLVVAITDLASGFKTAVPFVKQFLESFGAGVLETAPVVFSAVKDALGALTGNASESGNSLKLIGTTLGEVLVVGVGAAAILGGVLGEAVSAVSSIVQIASGIWDGLINTIGGAVFAVVDWSNNLGATLDALGPDLLGKMIAVGSAIVQGLVQGINGLVNLPFDAVDNIASGIKARFQNALGIHSPSTEFEWMGQMSTAGFSQGLEGSMPDVAPVVSNLIGGSIAGASQPSGLGPIVSSLASAPANTNGPARGGAPVSIGPITIEISGASDPGATAQEVKRVFLDELGDAFEQLGLETAAA